jgi:hypothetical protein
MQRRHFLRLATALAPALGFPQLLLGQKTDSARPVSGPDGFRYEWQHDWAQLPAGHKFGGATHGCAIDSEGLVYISHQGGPGSVFVFSPDGKFIRSMAPQHQGAGHGIDIRREHGEDFIYLSPNNGLKATKMNLKGEVLWESGPPPESHCYDKGAKFNSTNISFTPDGGWHVGDGYGSSFIHRYDKNGLYVSTMGGTGTEPGKFKTPHGHWFDDRDGIPKIVVCDRSNSRLQAMTLDGQLLKVVPDIDRPASIDIQDSLLLCTEVFIGRMVFLDANLNVLARLGDEPEWNKFVGTSAGLRGRPADWKAGKMVHPHDATFDKEGNILVVEWVDGGRVTKLKKVA